MSDREEDPKVEGRPKIGRIGDVLLHGQDVPDEFGPGPGVDEYTPDSGGEGGVGECTLGEGREGRKDRGVLVMDGFGPRFFGFGDGREEVDEGVGEGRVGLLRYEGGGGMEGEAQLPVDGEAGYLIEASRPGVAGGEEEIFDFVVSVFGLESSPLPPSTPLPPDGPLPLVHPDVGHAGRIRPPLTRLGHGRQMHQIVHVGYPHGGVEHSHGLPGSPPVVVDERGRLRPSVSRDVPE
mmetsp:Transcript_28846/g.85172  ORF Transcript_28846/g.85172 Transcript_28846/m.85172 type:complete len:236 (-) Transcript_28846:820-1527(-)